jgi:hypothetical protein
MILRYLALATVLLVFACSGEKKVAGTDTGNPVIQAMVTDSLGKPLDSAQVILYTDVATANISSLYRIATNTNSNDPVAIDTVYTDSKGRACFNAEATSKYSLEVYWKNRLGAFTELKSGTNDSDVEIEARNLIDFPTVGAATLEATGRYLPEGSTTKIPQGLWNIRYTLLGTDQQYSSLQIRVEDASNQPDAIASLGMAAKMLDSIDVQPFGYVELSQFPTDLAVKNTLIGACVEGGFSQVSMCESSQDCRIWQWETDWVLKSSGAAVLAAAVTVNAEIQCLFFPDGAVSNRPVFYSYSDVRKGP